MSASNNANESAVKKNRGGFDFVASRLGISQPYEMLFYLPSRAEDFTWVLEPDTIARAQGTRVNMVVKLLTEPEQVMKKAKPGAKPRPARPFRYSFLAVDDGGNKIRFTDFGALKASPWVGMRKNDVIHVQGMLGRFGEIYTMEDNLQIRPEWRGKFSPVYPGKQGQLSGEKITEFVNAALADPHSIRRAAEDLRGRFDGMAEDKILDLAKSKFPTLDALLKAIHFPKTVSDFRAARETAKNIAVQQVLYTAHKTRNRPYSARSAIYIDTAEIDRLAGRLPFPITNAQRRCSLEILRDINEPHPMDRLLSGDVGTGKTATYLLPAVAANRHGAKVVIMIPNQLLVKQICAEARQAFPDVQFELVMAGEKVAKINLDANPILLGTTSLLTYLAKHPHWQPDLLIVDEQQKMSREQREMLKASHTNMLEATATCVPRTAALVLHGGKSVSVLDEFPVQKTIRTKLVLDDQETHVQRLVARTLAAGKQSAVIYPKVEAGETGGPSVEEAFERWNKLYPGRVAMLHGKMKDEQKIDAMSMMKAGEFDLMIASTVVEVGVTVPRLASISVVNAENYGVSTLHQIRGRVARLGGAGYCLLAASDGAQEEAIARLRLLEQHSDGFVLADKDMEMRGFGDLEQDADAQHGASRGCFIGLDLMPADFASFIEPDSSPHEDVPKRPSPATAQAPQSAWKPSRFDREKAALAARQQPGPATRIARR